MISAMDDQNGLKFGSYLIRQKFGGHNFRRTKIFGGQNFRHQIKISAIMSAEFFSDKVTSGVLFRFLAGFLQTFYIGNDSGKILKIPKDSRDLEKIPKSPGFRK